MLTEISSAVTAIKSTIGLVSSLFETSKKLGQIANASLVIEIQENLLEVKTQLLEHEEKVLELELENRQLKQQISLSKELIFESPFYWLIKEEKKDGPFCQRCFDVDSKLVRLIRTDPYELEFSCRACNIHYESLEVVKRRREQFERLSHR